jgi:hypothetical protein
MLYNVLYLYLLDNFVVGFFGYVLIVSIIVQVFLIMVMGLMWAIIGLKMLGNGGVSCCCCCVFKW